MTPVTLSSKYQVVIPHEVRRAFKFVAGQRFEFVVHENAITLVPLDSIKQLRGIASGIDTEVARDVDRG